MPDIFISYRREDTSGYAGRLYDQISAHFGANHVFMDVADLEPGSDFVDTIEKKVGTCDALIALIGKNWLTIKDDQNQVRLRNPGDFVSIEVAAALKRNIEVIPVLVGGARMPAQRELPEALQLLGRRQALEISDVHFARDIGDLIEALKRPAGSRMDPSPKWRGPWPIAAISALGVLAIGIGLWSWRSAPHPPEPVKAVVTTPNLALAAPDITGNWKAIVQKEGTRYEIYFTFEVVGDKLFGKAIYPTGDAGILNGVISQGKISFITKHVPDFSDEEATITVEGKISGDEIQIFTQDKDGYSKGSAHRVTRLAEPKVFTR